MAAVLEPPTAYSLRFGAAARPKLLRAVGMVCALVTHSSVSGLYSSTMLRGTFPAASLYPPMA
jgi:hypothetical protein